MEEKKSSLLKSIVDLIELLIAYLRQELKSAVDDSLTRPLKRAGRKAGLAIVAGVLMSIASIFIAVGLFQLLAVLVGATWIAYLIIGAILVIFVIVIIQKSKGIDG